MNSDRAPLDHNRRNVFPDPELEFGVECKRRSRSGHPVVVAGAGQRVLYWRTLDVGAEASTLILTTV